MGKPAIKKGGHFLRGSPFNINIDEEINTTTTQIASTAKTIIKLLLSKKRKIPPQNKNRQPTLLYLIQGNSLSNLLKCYSTLQLGPSRHGFDFGSRSRLAAALIDAANVDFVDFRPV